MSLPVDLISYALGFTSTMNYLAFFFTTLIGVAPMAFIFTYASASSVFIQITVSIFAMTIFCIGMYFVYRGYKRDSGKESNQTVQ